MADPDARTESDQTPTAGAPELTRRSFLSQGAAALAGVTAVAAAMSPLRHLSAEHFPNLD